MQYNPTYMNHAAAVAAGVAVMKNFTPIYSVIPLKLPSFARADTLVGSRRGPSLLIPVSSLSPLSSPHLRTDVRTIPTCTWCSSSYPAGRCSATSGAWESLGSEEALLQLQEREKERELEKQPKRRGTHLLARSECRYVDR